MTYASDLGLTVGSKIKVGKGGSVFFREGSVITLVKDDNSNFPWFSSYCVKREPFSLTNNKWEHYKDTLTDEQFKDIVTKNPKAKFKIVSTVYSFGSHPAYTGICTYVEDAKEHCYGKYEMKLEGYPYTLSFKANELEYIEETIVTEPLKLKFPCCVSTAGMDEGTYDKIFKLFLDNGANEAESGYDYITINNYNYVGVDYDNDTMFWSMVDCYSENDDESEVTVYTTEQLLLLTKVADPTPLDNPWITWNGGDAPVSKGTKVDVRFGDGQEAIGIGSQDNSSVGGCEYIVGTWEHTGWYKDANIVAYRLHVPPVASQESHTATLTPEPSVTIQEEENELQVSTEPLVKVTPSYNVTIKGIDFTFTQDEINQLVYELEDYQRFDCDCGHCDE